MDEEGSIKGAPKSMRLPNRCETEMCGYCLEATLAQSFFGYRATLRPAAEAAGCTSGSFANARDADSVVRHRLMQCRKDLESSKSNYYSCATEVKRRV